MNIKTTDELYIAHTYNRFPVEIVSGKGSMLTDKNDKEYIDMGSGIGVNIFGAADKGFIDAVTKQLSLIQHTSNLYYTEPCVKLAKALCDKTGMKKVFFANSGAEANECAIKAARKYAAEKKGADCYNIVTLKNSFHGRTLTTLAATGQDCFHSLYNPLTPGFISVDAEDKDQIKTVFESEKIAAVMIECIQGEGGVNELSGDYISFLRDITKQKDILLIVDEVQTGCGRTGKLYSYMNYGITPDIVTSAKGLGGGLPIGAALLGEKVQDIFSYGDHGSTFGGNPVSCAGAYNIISRIDDTLLNEVTRKGELLKQALSASKDIKSVSGKGLMLGISTEKSALEVVKKCMEKGVLCLTAKNKVRLLPPLNTPDNLLIKAADIIINACKGE